MTELGRSAPGSMPVRGEFEIELVVILVDVLGRLPPVRAAGVALNGVDRRMAICVRLLIDRSHRGCARYVLAASITVLQDSAVLRKLLRA